MSQRDQADRFRALHAQDELLRLPNAWDAGSARVIEASGARAIATTSAGLAWANGYRDVNTLPLRTLADTARAIARAIRVPLTVDALAGLGDDVGAVSETVAALLEAGAVGVNLEDGTTPPELLARKIEAARSAGERAGVRLFVNARTDVHLKALVPKERAADEAIARGQRYRAAGADGLFVPGLADAASIRAIAQAVAMPLNVMLVPGLPSAKELHALGARRLSAGSAIAEAAYGLIRREATAFLGGEQLGVPSGRLPYPELNALFS